MTFNSFPDPCAVIDVLADVMIDVVSGIGVDLSADANVKVFAAVMTALEFVMTPPLEESMPFC